MDDASIEVIVNQIAPLLIGRAPGKIFQFNPTSFAIDFGLRREGHLFVSVDPALSRIHLIRRRVRDLERQKMQLNQFALGLRKELAATRLTSMSKDSDDRIVYFMFAGKDELGNEKSRQVIAQLTGLSANLVLSDSAGKIIQTARKTDLPGQKIGDVYARPATMKAWGRKNKEHELSQSIQDRNFTSASEAADAYYSSLIAERETSARLASMQAALRKKISQQEKLLKQLERDQQEHLNFEEHKRIGDLLLANLSTAKRRGRLVNLIDYFSDGSPEIVIEIDELVSLPDEASRRFVLYQRSKRALGQISKRMESVRAQIRKLTSELEDLPRTALAESGPASGTSPQQLLPTRAKPKPHRIPGTRRYISSDGFEILVGRAASDNDRLTFKIAKPNDLWLHAADYGGSHVVVRNSTRKDIPHRTLIEAAQLTAYFSQAKKDPKVDVHYTQRKFVSKPKGAKPGLVRLQRFKNITVEPRESLART